MNKEQRLGEMLEKLAIKIVRIIGMLIFGLLSVAALISSQYMLPGGEEIPMNKMDFPVWQILAVAAVAALVYVLIGFGERLEERGRKRFEKIVPIVSVLLVFLFGILWISSLNRVPEGDQAFIYAGASAFMEGDYSFFQRGGYCQIYPQQLDLMAFTEVLFRIVGPYRYFVFEMMNVCMAAGLVAIGYLLVKEQGGKFETRILYCVGMVCCSPLICYTSWVYGDIPGLFFMMLSCLFLLRLQRMGTWPEALFAVIAGVMALLLRRNNLIFLVALVLLAIVCMIGQKRWKMLVVTSLVYCGFLVCSIGIREIYEERSGYEIKQGLPTSSWIAMGMQEYRGVCGWYNNLPKEVAGRTGWDFEQTGQEMQEIIRDRVRTFISDPVYGVTFYGKKFLSQWNDPTYQGVYFSAKYKGNDAPKEGSFLDSLYNTEKGYFRYFEWANMGQFVVYLGMFLYFCFVRFEKGDIMKQILGVTIIGGAFFSLLWEAKARYIFPYYVMMIPLMSQGYAAVMRRIGRIKKTKG